MNHEIYREINNKVVSWRERIIIHEINKKLQSSDDDDNTIKV